jgi:hypothetical protein
MNKFQGKESMVQLKWIYLLLGISFFSYGCNFTLSQEEVKRSIYTVMRGYEVSTNDAHPQVSRRYSNAADVKFEAENETLVNEMKIMIKEDKRMTVSGTCFFSDYADPYSGYHVDGELAYDCEKSENDDAVCEFSCNTTLSGGKVKSLEFLLDINSDGEFSVASVIANGRKIEFSQWGFVANIVRSFATHLSAGL